MMNTYGYPTQYAQPVFYSNQPYPSSSAGYPPAPGGRGYGEPLPPMQGLPTPSPSIAYDVNEFRSFYRYGLQQLVSNNKFIINDLTNLADLFKYRMAAPIGKEIEQHLRECPPTLKLSVFYVLDSICKNVGPPYPQIFKPFIEMAVLQAYRQMEDIDPNSTVKYHELFGTWRTSGPNRTELFGEDVQKRIEGGVFGHWGPNHDASKNDAYSSGMNGQPATASPMEKSNVLYDLRRILSDRERMACQYPHDQANIAQISTLQQLEHLVINQQLTLIQIDEIRQQLRQIRPPTPPPAPALFPEHPLEPVLTAIDPATLASLTAMLAENPSLLLEAAQSSLSSSSGFDELSVPLQQAASLIGNATEGLSKTGFTDTALADALASLAGAAVATTNPHTMGESEAADVFNSDVEDHFITDYEDAVASLDLELTNSSLSQPRHGLSTFLYDRIPQFCRQDGARFLKGPIGEKRSSAHLDSLFRYHKRIRESTGRAQQRVWASSAEDWILSRDFGFSAAEEGTSKTGSSSTSAIPEIDHNTRTVQKPDGVDAGKPCPVCKEGFLTRFDEDEAEFLWINAVLVDDGGRSVWHSTCRTEYLAGRGKVAGGGVKKLKTEATGERGSSSTCRQGSREATPSSASGAIASLKDLKVTPLRDQVLGKRKSASPRSASLPTFDGDLKRVKSEFLEVKVEEIVAS